MKTKLKENLQYILEKQQEKTRLSAIVDLLEKYDIQATAKLDYQVIPTKDKVLGTTNLVLSFNTDIAGPITVIGAHYDVFGTSQGMNDNGVAISALIQIARILKRIPCKRRIDLVFFDREETGMNGSNLYIQTVGQENISKAIILDIIAYGNSIYGSFSDNFILHYMPDNVRRLEHALPSDNVIFSIYNVKNVLLTVGHEDDILPVFNKSRGMLVYRSRVGAKFYESFHNRKLDNRFEILNFKIAREVYKAALVEALNA